MMRRLIVLLLLVPLAPCLGVAQDTLRAPVLVEPANGSGRWVDDCMVWEAVASATDYRLKVAPDSATFGMPIIDLVTNGTYICSTIAPGHYKWHVQAGAFNAISPWSETWYFESVFPVDTEEHDGLGAQLLLSNYPNPFAHQTTVQFQLPVASDVTVSVFDSQGRQLMDVLSGHMAAGHHRLAWSPTNIAAGQYYLRLVTREQAVVHPITVVQ